MKKYLFFITLTFIIFSTTSIAQGIDEFESLDFYKKQCEEISSFIGEKYKVNCSHNYHHYNSDTKKNYSLKKARAKKNLKIAEFNMLHPGMSKTRFKDYKIVAKMINEWDVLVATELLPLLNEDQKHNQALVRFLGDTPTLIKNVEISLEKAKEQNPQSKEHIYALEDLLLQLQKDLLNAHRLYKVPGFIKILEELHALENGKEWSLILMPKGEAAKDGDVEELVGFYYRSSVVKPIINNYCKSIATKDQNTPVACIPTMSPSAMGEDYRFLFSRRPFMGSFQSNKFQFTLLGSHVVYNSPTASEMRSKIMTTVFDVDHPSKLGTGINISNYARFAEVKATLMFMEKLKVNFKMKNLIYTGDLNLEASNPFFKEVLKSFNGAQLFIDQKTSVSEKRFLTNGKATNGLASNYDHFIFNPQEFQNCLKENQPDGGAYSFYDGAIAEMIRDKYIVRYEDTQGPYRMDEEKKNRLLFEYGKAYDLGLLNNIRISSMKIGMGKTSISIPIFINDDKNKETFLDEFTRRIITSTLKDSTYYSIFKEIISDHLPIVMNCRI